MLLALINSLKPAVRLMVLVSLFLIVFPKMLDRVDSRGIAALPFAISVDDSSLAVMALADVRTEFDGTDEVQTQGILENWGQVTLNAGNESQPILERIFPPEPVEPAPEMNADPDQLTGMVISQQSKDTPAPVILASAMPPKNIEQVVLTDVYGAMQPLEIRKQKLLAAAKTQDLRQPSVHDEAQKLIEQAIQEKKRDQVRRVIASQTGGQILVSKPGSAMDRPPSNKSRQPANLKNSDDVVRQDLRPTRWEDHHERPVVISGSISFGNGLAYTNDHHLSISRVFDGETRESANIWIRDARFEIPVKRAKGYLVAELHDHSGLLVAYMEYDLSKLPEVPKNDYRVSGVHLSLKPVEQGAIVHVVSGYSYKDKIIPVEDAAVSLLPFDSELKKNIEGQFVEPTLEAGSDIVVKVEARDHWSTLARVTSGTVATVRLFHKSMMQALIDIVSLNEMERKENQTKGIIWGLITENGKPVSGARVEVSGSTGPLSYINGFYLPDVAMKATSENGMFAIVGAESGLQSLRVVYKDIQYPAQVLRAESGHVSFIEINFEKLKSVRLKVVDELSMEEKVNATIRTLGSDTVIDNVTSSLDMETQKFPLSYHFLEADAGVDYEMVRIEEPLSKNFIRFPLVQRQWLTGILARLKVNKVPEAGVIVGWVQEEGFDVLLDDGKSRPDMNTLYFNESGQLVSQGENPSGFIIYNVPAGQRTITILPHSRKSVITKVLTVDSDFVSVIHK